MHNTFPVKVSSPKSVQSVSKRIGNCQVLQASDEHIVINFVSALHNANEESLVFCSLDAGAEIESAVNKTRARVVIVSQEVSVSNGKVIIIVNDPLEWFIKALNLLFDYGSDRPVGTIPTASLLDNGISVGEGTVIETGARIGSNCIIGSNCFIGKQVIIRDNAFIQNNTSIGGVGLGYYVTKSKERLFFPHLGSVFIGENVVIGSGCVIVRGQLQDTMIGENSRMGNLVNVGHNVSIGADCVISSNTCITGGVSIGNGSNIAAGVTINSKLRIGDGCQIGLGSVVTKNIARNTSVFGNPAKPLPTMRRF